MLVALVDHAVEKLVRGPTSTTVCVGSLPSNMLSGVRCSGSKVSRNNLWAAAGQEGHMAQAVVTMPYATVYMQCKYMQWILQIKQYRQGRVWTWSP